MAPYNYTSNTISPDPYLDDQELRAITFSIGNKKGNFTNTFTASYLQYKNLVYVKPSANQTPVITNFDKDLDALLLYVNSRYKFNTNHELKTLFSYGELGQTMIDDSVNIINGEITLLNKFDKFQFFNRFLFKETLEGTQTGFTSNYSLGGTYRHSDRLSISIKGENIFYDDDENSNILIANPSTPDIPQIVQFQDNDRVFLISMEYLF